MGLAKSASQRGSPQTPPKQWQNEWPWQWIFPRIASAKIPRTTFLLFSLESGDKNFVKILEGEVGGSCYFIFFILDKLATKISTAHRAPSAPTPTPATMFSMQYMFPFPGQEGAPYFDGKNITQFLNIWEDLTLGWPNETKIRKIPLYCQAWMGKYIKTLHSYKVIEEDGWEKFKKEVLEEFKDEGEEQQKYTEGYLQKTALDIRNREGGMADYRAFILDFCEKAEVLVGKGMISEYKRVTLFLQAFSDKVGDKLCRKYDIDLDKPATTTNVFTKLRKEALVLCVNEARR